MSIDDKTGRLQHSANERRAWCFEVRVYGDRGVFEDLAFAVVRQEFWQLALDESSATPEAKAHLLSLQRSGKVHTCDAVGPDPCVFAPALVAGYVASSGGRA